MKYLVIQLYNLLSDYGNVYHEKVDNQQVAFPYIIFSNNVVGTDYDMLNNRLTIDVWGDNQTKTQVYDIAENIRKDLSFYKYTDENLGYSMRLTNFIEIQDPDENIKRVQLQFEINLFIK